MLELIESKLIMILLTQTLISVVLYGLVFHRLFFFSLFTVTFLRNSENSPFKHVESFSQNKCKPKTQHSRTVMKPKTG